MNALGETGVECAPSGEGYDQRLQEMQEIVFCFVYIVREGLSLHFTRSAQRRALRKMHCQLQSKCWAIAKSVDRYCFRVRNSCVAV